MKKLLAVVLAVIMVMSFAACSANTEKDNKAKTASTSSINVDMSKYPADFKDWTAQNLVDYFKEDVNFPSNCETWVQDHATYWAGLPVYEASGIWNVAGAGDVSIMFTVFNPDSSDTTPEDVEAVKQIIREDKNHDYTTDKLFLGPQDHMVGHVAFAYSDVLNEEVYNAVDAAYNYLVEAMGVTPDF